MANLENRVIRKKKLEQANLRILRNEAGNRLFVEFSSEDGKITLQKSFQDNFQGRKDAETFENSITSLEDLKNYFGIKK